MAIVKAKRCPVCKKKMVYFYGWICPEQAYWLMKCKRNGFDAAIARGVEKERDHESLPISGV